MNQYPELDKLNLFKDLFKGRDDVFTIRWEKGNKSTIKFSTSPTTHSGGHCATFTKEI